MVVVEHGRNHINEEVEFTVTNTVQKSAGKMIFGRLDGNGAGAVAGAEEHAGSPAHARPRHRHEPAPTEKQ
jgi:hypothetical protein